MLLVKYNKEQDTSKGATGWWLSVPKIYFNLQLTEHFYQVRVCWHSRTPDISHPNLKSEKGDIFAADQKCRILNVAGKVGQTVHRFILDEIWP